MKQIYMQTNRQSHPKRTLEHTNKSKDNHSNKQTCNLNTHILEQLCISISEFDNSDYDALWDGRGDIAMHKTNGDIPRDPVTFPTIASYRTRLKTRVKLFECIPHSDSTHSIQINMCDILDLTTSAHARLLRGM